MAVKFTNNAATTLAAGINSSVTSIAVTDGSVFPTITGSDHFYVTFDDTTNKEIVKVTARSGNTLTVVRGHDNTTARAFSSGDKAELRIVAALLEDVKTDVSSTLTVDTFTGDGSTTAFTLSVAPASEDNLIVFIEGVYQNPGDFTLSGTTLTLDVAPANSRKIIVYHVAALVSGNNLTHNQFTCNGSTTAFTLGLSPIHENNTQVFLDGVYQQKTDYAVSGTTLTMDTAPANGAILEVMTFTQTEVNTLPASFVSGLTEVTAVGADHFMIFDATDSALKKSLVSDVLESATSISTSADATAITIDSNEKVTFTSDVTTGGHLSVGGSNNELRFYEGSNYVGFEAPALSADKIWVLPAADGSNGQVIKTDGSGNLSFTTIDTSISANSVGITELNVSDGSNGQVLQTNGSGTLSFATVSSGPTFKTFGTSSFMVGDDATGTINAADYNTGVGVDIFKALTEGNNNVAVGFNALTALTTGIQNTAIGTNTLQTLTTASYNTAVGQSALLANTSGANNTSVGALSLPANTTASNNTGIGFGALYGTTTGASNTAVGSGALLANSTGATNVAVGYQALNSNTTGYDNVAIGVEALDANTTGYLNVCIGKSAGTALTGGVYSNTIVGATAGTSMNSGVMNTAIGQGAMQLGTSGSANVAVGAGALLRIGTANYNVSVGQLAGQNITSGNGNVFIGYNAGEDFTTGTDNIYIGNQAGTTEYNAGSNRIVIGPSLNADGNNKVFIGKSGSAVSLNFTSSGSWSQSSDERKKQNIQNDTLGLDFINDLRTVTYKWKSSTDFPKDWRDYNEENTQDTDVVMHGMVAQEVKSALDKAGVSTFAGWHEQSDGMQMVSREMFVLPLIKAVQELTTRLEAAEAKIKTLEG